MTTETNTIEVDWTRLTGPDLRALAARENALAILPTGSLEQHGPHLPVITDTKIAREVSLRAARLVAAEVPVAVLPGVWTGLSEHHFPFGGTISLNFNEFRGVLTGVVRSLKVLGFARLAVVNGHGGNVEPLAVIVRELAHEFGLPVVAIAAGRVVAEQAATILEGGGKGGHSEEGETSQILALLPDLVRTDRLEEAAREVPSVVPRWPVHSRFWSFSERAPVTGVLGADPRLGSAAKGERLLDAKAEAVAEAIRDPVLWRRPDPVWTPGRGQGSTAGSALD